MSAVTATPAVFARKALAGKAVAAKRTATKARAAFSVSANAKVDACDKNSVIVSPSILSANFATLGEEVRVVGVRTIERSSHTPSLFLSLSFSFSVTTRGQKDQFTHVIARDAPRFVRAFPPRSPHATGPIVTTRK